MPDSPAKTDRATRVVRVAAISAVVLGLEWRLADPETILSDPVLRITPWAMLALLFPVAIGVWTFEIAGKHRSAVKADLLWSVLVGTFLYLAVLLVNF